jgi:hypothetical protein
MKSLRAGVLVAVVVLAGLNAHVAGSSSPRAGSLALSVSTKVASLKFSWNELTSRHVTYIVNSSPAGKSCQVTDASSCEISVTDAVPWIFQVTAYVPGKPTVSSSWTAPVKRRLVIIVAGQSNAIGATSYALDPTTHINYFAPPFSSSADRADAINWQPFDLKSLSDGVPVALNTPQNFYSHVVFGPELSLARTLAHDKGITVTIIKAAQTDTSLAFNWDPARTTGSFVVLLNQVRRVMQHDAQRGQLDVLSSFVWYQGESDANVGAPNYQGELKNFISALRARLPISLAAPVVLIKESIAKLINYRKDHGFCKKDGCIAQVRGDAAVRAADDFAAAHLFHVSEVDSLSAARTTASNFVHLSNVGELQVGAAVAHKIELALP